MKLFLRKLAVAIVVGTLSLSLTSVVSAAPRGLHQRPEPGIVKVLKKISKILGIGTNDDQPVPPKP